MLDVVIDRGAVRYPDTAAGSWSAQGRPVMDQVEREAPEVELVVGPTS